jgi:hypothetical protein
MRRTPAEIARAQGHLFFGVIPAWGIIYQPLGFLGFVYMTIKQGLVDMEQMK